MNFDWKIIGQDGALESLEADIESGKPSHAYLFAGADSVGKFATAKRMACILQCPSGGCGKCNVCKEIEKNYHADTLQILDGSSGSGLSGGEKIKIEEIRKCLEKLNMTKSCPYKVLLLQSAERLTPESANALLKTLEDPPRNVIFLLTTDRLKDVMTTILSRVRIVRFKRLPDEDMHKLLKSYSPFIEDKKLNDICAFAMGRPGKALSLLDNRDLFNLYSKLYADMENFLDNPDRVEQFKYVAELVVASKEENGAIAVREFLDVFQLVARRKLMALVSGEKDALKIVKITVILEEIQKGLELLRRNVNNRLLLENLMLKI